MDIGRLYIYEDMDLLAEINSPILDQNISAHLKSKRNTWFGLSKRSRIIATSKERVKENDILRVEDLAKPKWKGKICSRPGSHVYNRALMASVIAEYGLEKAEEWAIGLVSNLARRPQGNDRAQVMAVAYGEAELAIVNHYYLGIMLSGKSGEKQKSAAEKVSVAFPNTNNRGVHVNNWTWLNCINNWVFISI